MSNAFDQAAYEQVLPYTAADRVTPANLDAALAEIVKIGEKVNGPNSFDLVSSAYGYIKQHFKLQFGTSERAMLIAIQQNPKTHDVNIVQLLSMASLLFARKRHGSVSVGTALFMSIFQMRLIAEGYLYTEKDARGVTVDEVVWDATWTNYHDREYNATRPDPADATVQIPSAYHDAYDAAQNDTARVKAYMEHGPDNSFKQFLNILSKSENLEMYKDLVLCAPQMAAMAHLVFKQFGHHYMDEYNSKYETLWKATTLEKPKGFGTWEDIMRNALHPFGVKALMEKYYERYDEAKLAEALYDRANVAPTGTAIIAVAYAAIQTMKGMPMWQNVESMFKDSIKALEADYTKIADHRNSHKFHRNAKLYGLPARDQTLSTDSAKILAPLAKGLIKALGSESDLSKQKALDKVAAQNPVMVKMIAGVLETFSDKVTASGDFNAILAPQPKI